MTVAAALETENRWEIDKSFAEGNQVRLIQDAANSWGHQGGALAGVRLGARWRLESNMYYPILNVIRIS